MGINIVWLFGLRFVWVNFEWFDYWIMLFLAVFVIKYIFVWRQLNSKTLAWRYLSLLSWHRSHKKYWLSWHTLIMIDIASIYSSKWYFHILKRKIFLWNKIEAIIKICYFTLQISTSKSIENEMKLNFMQIKKMWVFFVKLTQQLWLFGVYLGKDTTFLKVSTLYCPIGH